MQRLSVPVLGRSLTATGASIAHDNYSPNPNPAAAPNPSTNHNSNLILTVMPERNPIPRTLTLNPDAYADPNPQPFAAALGTVSLWMRDTARSGSMGVAGGIRVSVTMRAGL